MSKFIGVLLLVALAVRLVVLFFFKQNIVLNEISLVLFIAVFVVAAIVFLHARKKKGGYGCSGCSGGCIGCEKSEKEE